MSRVSLTAKRRTVTPRMRSEPSGILVLPGDVVARAGRQHLDLVLRRESLRDQAAVIFRPAEDLGSVTLNDECKFHNLPFGDRPRVSWACPKLAPSSTQVGAVSDTAEIASFSRPTSRDSLKCSSRVYCAAIDLRAHHGIECQLAEQLRRKFQILRRPAHAGAAQRFADRACSRRRTPARRPPSLRAPARRTPRARSTKGRRSPSDSTPPAPSRSRRPETGNDPAACRTRVISARTAAW